MALHLLQTAGTLRRHLEVIDRFLVVGGLQMLNHHKTGVERDFGIVLQLGVVAGLLQQLDGLLRVLDRDRGNAILIELVEIRVESDQTLQTADHIFDIALVDRAQRTHIVHKKHPLDVSGELVEAADFSGIRAR